MSGEFFRVELDEPIKAHGEEMTELVLREPTVGDFKGIRVGGEEGFDLGQITLVLSRLAGIPPSAAEKIPVLKLLPLQEKLKSFLP